MADINPLSKSDYDAWLPLWRGYQTFYHADIPDETTRLTFAHDLFVADAMRGSGVGRKLIEAVYEVARTRGCSRVYWLTQETNVRAMALYDKVAQKSGFVQYVKRFG